VGVAVYAIQKFCFGASGVLVGSFLFVKYSKTINQEPSVCPKSPAP